MFKLLLTGIFTFLLFSGSFCQNLLNYSFIGCTLSETSGNSRNVSALSNVICECGVNNEAIRVDGQQLSWPMELDSFFKNNFTIGFSVQIQNTSGEVDLFSKTKSCNSDTILSISYRTSDSLFVVTLREGFDEIVTMNAKADPNKCWQQFYLTKNNGDIRIYLNGKLKKQQISNFVLRLDNGMPLKFNSSPCQQVGFVPCLGKLDEVYIADYALNSSFIFDRFEKEQEILTPDTLIFLGTSFSLRAQSNCLVSFSWNPTIQLSSPNSLETVASPQVTTLYIANFQLGLCSVKDSVLVRVVDKDKVECESLRLPTAFSPNQDGINDEFGISNPYLIEELDYFDILDRNGGIIAQFNNANGKWDGYFNGVKLNPGSYLYRIGYTCKSNEYSTKGSVYLLR